MGRGPLTTPVNMLIPVTNVSVFRHASGVLLELLEFVYQLHISKHAPSIQHPFHRRRNTQHLCVRVWDAVVEHVRIVVRVVVPMLIDVGVALGLRRADMAA